MRFCLAVFLLLTGVLITSEAKVCKRLPKLPDHMTKKKLTQLKGSRQIGVKYKFECEYGYHLKGSANTKCVRRSSGKSPVWNKKIPTCEVDPKCQPPPALGDFTKIVSEIEERYCPGSTVIFACLDGAQKVSGSKERTLKEDGNWTDEKLVCKKSEKNNPEIIQCSRPPRPVNGFIVGHKLKYDVGEMVLYNCSEGNYMHGHSGQECLENGTWCGRQPECRPFSCPPIRAPLNGYIEFSSAMKVQFSCIDGFDTIGNDTLLCMPNGIWSGNAPKCIRNCGGCQVSKSVQLPSSRSNSKGIGNQVSDYAVDGRLLRSFLHCAVTCLYTGKSEAFGSKNPRLWIDMKRSYDVSSVTVRGVTTISDIAIKKYKIDWVRSFYPKEDVTDISGFLVHVSETWHEPNRNTDSEQRSAAVQCGSREDTLRNKTDYDVCCDKYIRGRYLTIYIPGKHRILSVCEVEIYVKPYNNQCEQKSKFKHGPANVNCPDPGLVLNAYRSKRSREIFQVNEQIKFTCNECFELHGDHTITCGSDGTWKYKAFPQCIKLPCTENAVMNPKPDFFCAYEDLPNGNISPSNNLNRALFNEAVQLECNENFLLSGAKKLTCVGQCIWDDQWPECIPETCNKLPDPFYGQFSPKKQLYNVGSNITLRCDRGFEVAGNATLTCESNLEWSHEPQTCKRVKCSKPQLNKNVLVSPDRETYFYETKVDFFCEKDFFELKGNTTSECNYDGNWTNLSPTCKDPCEDEPCDKSLHKKVILDENKECQCVCQDESDCSEVDDPVCGSDAKTYKTECHMKAAACREEKTILFVSKGKCKQGGVCSAPKPSGSCPGYEIKWFYNAAKRKCEKFDYGSCFQGINVFDTEHECYKTCQCEVFCKQSRDRGLCRNATNNRFYYDWSDGTCKTLYYNGCSGNNNHFFDERSCRTTCSNQRRQPLPRGNCPFRHNLTIAEACKARKTSRENFLITLTVNSDRQTINDESGFVVTVGKKYWGPPSLSEFNQVFLIIKGTLICPCKALLHKGKYLVFGVYREGSRWPEFSDRSLVYPFANFQKLEETVQDECPDLYL